jgi:hypothetical protein
VRLVADGGMPQLRATDEAGGVRDGVEEEAEEGEARKEDAIEAAGAEERRRREKREARGGRRSEGRALPLSRDRDGGTLQETGKALGVSTKSNYQLAAFINCVYIRRPGVVNKGVLVRCRFLSRTYIV